MSDLKTHVSKVSQSVDYRTKENQQKKEISGSGGVARTFDALGVVADLESTSVKIETGTRPHRRGAGEDGNKQ